MYSSSFCPSPRPSHQHTSAVWLEQFAQERQELQQEIRAQLRRSMASIIGHQPTADLLLVSADGKKMPAHLCILKRRAPHFFQRYIQATMEAATPRQPRHHHAQHQRQLLEIAVGDVDSNALEFFIRSIYTDDEIYGLKPAVGGQMPQTGNANDDDGDGGNDDGNTENAHFYSMIEEGHPHENDQGYPHHQQQGYGFMPENSSDQRRMSSSSPANVHHLDYRQQTTIPELDLISFRELACTRIPVQTCQGGTKEPIGTTASSSRLIPKFIGMQCRPDKEEESADSDVQQTNFANKNQHEMRQQHSSSIFPFFIGINPPADPTIPMPSSSASVSSVMTRSLPSATATMSNTMVQSSVDEQGRQRSCDSPSGTGLELVNSIRCRAMAARRLSVSSMNSLVSIDIQTPSQEWAPYTLATILGQHMSANGSDDYAQPCGQLGADLLAMLEEDGDLADTRLLAADGHELFVHSCILWASGSEFFKEHLAASKFAPCPGRRCKIEMRRFSHESVHFLLKFIYGGISTIPQAFATELDPWELVELGAYTKLDLFIQMVVLHIRAMFCHFFHRPCASCVSAVFEALPKMELEIPAIKQLFGDAMQWQAAHFIRIWRGRVFMHLSEQWQKHCRDALLQSVDEENVIEVLLGCEKLQLALPRLKVQMPAQRVAKMVRDVEEYCLEFLANSLDFLIQSRAFSAYGKGLALNLTLLEEILPPMVHSLTADTTIRSFLAIKEVLATIKLASNDEYSSQQLYENRKQSSSGTSSCQNSPLKKASPCYGQMLAHRSPFLHGSNQSLTSASWREQLLMNEWNPRFKCLCHRLLELLDRHMLHYANSIVNSSEWKLLNAEEQNRVREFGLFVEMRMPRVGPPRLSSAGRSYKRSSSVGFGQFVSGSNSVGGGYSSSTPMSSPHYSERAHSLERKGGGGCIGPRAALHLHSSRPSLSTQMEEETVASNASAESPCKTAATDLLNDICEADGTGHEEKLIASSRKVVEEEDKKMPTIRETIKSDQGISPTTTIASKVPMPEAKKQTDAANSLQKRKRNEKAATTAAATNTTTNTTTTTTNTASIPALASTLITSTPAPSTASPIMTAASSAMTTASSTSHNTLPSVMETAEENANSKKITAKDQSGAFNKSTAPNLAKAVTDAIELIPSKITQFVSNISDELVPIDTSEVESAPVEVTTNVDSPKLHHSRRSNPSPLVMERQRTHTVMTVDQNLRAGINAYLEGIAGGQQTHQIIKKHGSKPQSIVRPMPKMPPVASTNSTGMEMPQNPSTSMAVTGVQISTREGGRTRTKMTRIMAGKMGGSGNGKIAQQPQISCAASATGGTTRMRRPMVVKK